MKSSSDGDGSSKKPPGPLSLVRRGPKEVGRWWKLSGRQTLADVVDQTNLAKAVSDAGVLALAHLVRRLCEDDTPVHVKDKIALSLGPKVMVQIGVHRHAGDTSQTDQELLDAYDKSRDQLDS
jgi:hypothetical protein